MAGALVCWKMLLFQKPNPPQGSVLGGVLPITPSLTFSDTAVTQGTIHLDILAGREGVRGASGGKPGGDRLVGWIAAVGRQGIPHPGHGHQRRDGGGLLELRSLLRQGLEGQVLSQSGQLSVTPAAPVAAGSSLVVARVDYIQNVPMFKVVALGQVSGTTVISQPYPGLPGIVLGARYVFFQLTAPIGFVSGVTSSSAGPIQSVVTTQGLPFIGVSAADGTYTVAATAGAVSLSANVPLTFPPRECHRDRHRCSTPLGVGGGSGTLPEAADCSFRGCSRCVDGGPQRRGAVLLDAAPLSTDDEADRSTKRLATRLGTRKGRRSSGSRKATSNRSTDPDECSRGGLRASRCAARMPK